MEWLSERHLGEWRHAVDRFWQAEAPDWTEVGHVVATIAAGAEEADLRHAATQAQPSIRNAAASPQDRMTGVVARRWMSSCLKECFRPSKTEWKYSSEVPTFFYIYHW